MKELFNLQLFADDAASDSAPGTAEKADGVGAAADTGKDKPAGPEKKYTDEDVDRIVKNRLAREREQAKKEKEARKNQKVVDIKEVRLSAKIDVADFNVRVKQAEKFLKGGDKVKASIRFRGREMAHTDIGLTVMQRFAEACAEFGTVEKAAKLEGRQMLMFIAPKK